MLGKVSDALNRVVERLCFLALAAMVAVITAQVVFRVYFKALSWSEEVGRYLLVWITFLGASIGVKRGSHMAVTAFLSLFPAQARRLASWLASTLCCAFFVIMIVYGSRLMRLQRLQTSPALNMPMYIVYSVIPMSGVVMLVHTLAKLTREGDPR